MAIKSFFIFQSKRYSHEEKRSVTSQYNQEIGDSQVSRHLTDESETFGGVEKDFNNENKTGDTNEDVMEDTIDRTDEPFNGCTVLSMDVSMMELKLVHMISIQMSCQVDITLM
ncbi:hypothetical protein JCM33374_g3835 [Metschnikowia sp. JCM 33374]|nr:hypothetical protein JCM33374_g3835 [Metschnikowia sp. JCM 33374]